MAIVYKYMFVALTILDILAYGLIISFEPSKQDVIVDEINSFNQNGVFVTHKGSSTPSILSSFYAVSSLDILNRLSGFNSAPILNFIKSRYDNQTNLFLDRDGEPSLHTTWAALALLSKFNAIDQYNRTK